MGKLARDNRNREITIIQIARRQLQLPDVQYYDLLRELGGGATSSKDLDAIGRSAVIKHMKVLGFLPTQSRSTKRPRRPLPSSDRLPLVRRIRAQLISLDHKPDEYADGVAKQMLGENAPEYFEWCEPRDLLKISQALGVEQQRKGAPTR
jgi:phage gp16-like protein